MTFSVKERILLFGLLPTEGDILSLRTVRRIREAISFSDEEKTALNIRQSGASFQWDQPADHGKEIEMGTTASRMIRDALERLNKEGKLTEDHIDLWDKFVPETTAGDE